MRPGVAAALMVSLVCACAPGSAPIRVTAPVAATQDELLPHYGSYSTDDGDVLVIARLGWFADLRDGTYRTLYASGEAGHFTIGQGFEEPLPKLADLVFHGDELQISAGKQTRTAHRIAYTHTDVTIPAAGAQLAGTITEPLGAGPHRGIVIVHARNEASASSTTSGLVSTRAWAWLC